VVETFCAILMVGNMYVMDCIQFKDIGKEPMSAYECLEFTEKARPTIADYDDATNRYILKTYESELIGFYCGDPKKNNE